MKKISSFSRNNNNFLKLYIALFTFLSQTSNTFSFMDHTYYVAEDKRIIFKIMACILFLIPGTALIIFNKIDKLFNLSLLLSVVSYTLLYLLMILIYGKIIKYYLFKHVLKKEL